MCATFVIFTSSCAQQYGGPNCNAISTSTRPETIPEFDAARLAPAEDGLFTAASFIAGTEEVACCAIQVNFVWPRCTKEVDCDAYVKTLRTISLDGKYKFETCGPFQGEATLCQVLIDEQSRIVGVRTRCAN